MSTRMTRYAVVHQRRGDNVSAYLPGNYRVVYTATHDPEGGTNVVVAGEDSAGWTLDGYVLPRLASGMLYGREYKSIDDARDAASASMN